MKYKLSDIVKDYHSHMTGYYQLIYTFNGDRMELQCLITNDKSSYHKIHNSLILITDIFSEVT